MRAGGTGLLSSKKASREHSRAIHTLSRSVSVSAASAWELPMASGALKSKAVSDVKSLVTALTPIRLEGQSRSM